MLLYWGMFTVGFSIGAIFSFITFAPKKPEEELTLNDKEDSTALDFWKNPQSVPGTP